MKTKIIKVRLDSEAVNLLRHKGGFHTTKKGKRGYNRKAEKKALHSELKG